MQKCRNADGLTPLHLACEHDYGCSLVTMLSPSKERVGELAIDTDAAYVFSPAQLFYIKDKSCIEILEFTPNKVTKFYNRLSPVPK